MIISQKHNDLEYLVSQGIQVPHCFTTRLGGVSTGIFASMNIANKEGERPENVEKNLNILAQEFGFCIQDMVLTQQTHTDIVRVVSKKDHQGLHHKAYPICDALVTNDPGTTLMVYTADCTPLLFHDPVTGAVGAAHAGWRGTAAAIGAKTAQAMVDAFGCRMEDIRCAIGPNIGFCHFETDEDVPNAMVSAFGEEAKAFIRQCGEKYYVNLKEINALSLRQVGIRYIEISDECTMCQPDRYWSHRITGSARGSQGGLIVCKEVRP